MLLADPDKFPGTRERPRLRGGDLDVLVTEPGADLPH